VRSEEIAGRSEAEKVRANKEVKGRGLPSLEKAQGLGVPFKVRRDPVP